MEVNLIRIHAVMITQIIAMVYECVKCEHRFSCMDTLWIGVWGYNEHIK